jgi:hypothetical protein
MTERGIPKAFRNHEPTILEQIKANLDAQFSPPVIVPFAQPIPRTETYFGTGQIIVTTVPVQIVGVFARKGIKITNLSSTVQVFIGNNQAVSINSGDLLIAGVGSWVAYATKSAIWAVVASGLGNGLVSYAEVY